MLPTLATSIPDSVILGIIALCAVLALATLVFVFVRMQPAPAGEERRPPFDPVLLGSAAAVLIMAIFAYLAL